LQEQRSKEKHVRKAFKKDFIQISFGVISLVAAIFAIYTQFVDVRDKLSDRREAEQMQRVIAEERLRHSEEQLEVYKQQFKSLIDEKLTLADEDVSKLSIANKLQTLNDRLAKVDELTLALRQAINPLNPEEVLTIARLTDEVKSLKAEYSGLEVAIKEKHTEFSNSILRELKSSNDATNLILVVLIPLLLNFLYTIWKDFKVERREESSNNQSLPDS